MYNVHDWYWIVGGNGPNIPLTGDDTQVYSSRMNAYVSSDDPAYLDWLGGEGHTATRIDTEANLAAVLAEAGLSTAALAEAKPQIITSTAFLNRFTNDERTALSGAAMSNPQMLLLLITLAAAGNVDLGDPSVQAGVNGLVPGVLATPTRAAEILDH
jgi:hypothetical protein